ncbi:C40 family peptidase [Pontibacter litorisediminis]|uniref:C40 family peptidase n=1 Tax=Pontibacter litorisediminis TaxID=1846260 RepID=UPI0023EADDBE|nr:NlpC/P60 family protein [Pontibacter litorisediminis]
MKKAAILSALAILSLVLSYFYEVAPASRPVTEQAMALPAITPYPLDTQAYVPYAWAEYMMPDKEAEEPHEEYYIKKLGLRFRNPDYRALVEAASKWIGTPYRYGSSSKRGTDCSGLVTSLYQEVYGINLSRSSRSMFQDVARIKKDSVRTGDLVFFRRSAKGPIFHVGIYLKNNKFIHSSTTRGVMVSSLSEPYFRNRYFAAGRVN